MCSVIIYRNPDKKSQWPVLVAENRDESLTRPWKKPSNYWQEYPDIFAGLDLATSTKGSWIGLNKSGVFSTIVNRSREVQQQVRKKTRG